MLLVSLNDTFLCLFCWLFNFCVDGKMGSRAPFIFQNVLAVVVVVIIILSLLDT